MQQEVATDKVEHKVHRLIGKPIKTQFGIAIVKSFIRSKNWFAIEYPDGAMGWVNESQFTEVEELDGYYG
ncbi:hypothetical protein [Moritella sp. F3]|uniref:hypothetical protein n=1 Tax=Moritella sp. F3 TaxID=2718882 RepID=UPI0018E12C7F|nr:hypothetical protein [Moritella sp. F3]GIC77188.1 hypothetical protein FMO001_19150 [Moritella sp. F1]GIC82307.1 hypothetical protein FMO003_25880 [Moritella sp. F3]